MKLFTKRATRNVFALSKTMLVCCTSLGLLGCSQKRIPEDRAEVRLLPFEDLFAKPIRGLDRYSSSRWVAFVNGEAISEAEQTREIEKILKLRATENKFTKNEEQAISLEAIDNLIVQKLIEQEINDRDIEISTNDVDLAVWRIRGSIPEGISLVGFLGREGVTLLQFKKQLAELLQMQQLVFGAEIPEQEVSETDIQEFYDKHPDIPVTAAQITAEQIVIDRENTLPDIEKLNRENVAQDVYRAYVQGSSLEEIATRYKDVPFLRTRVVTLPRGVLLPALDEVLFSLNPDEISLITPSLNGLHIFKNLAVIPSRSVPLNVVENDIRRLILQQQDHEMATNYVLRLNQLIHSLRENAQINIVQ